MQQSRTATDNLMKLIQKKGIYVAFIRGFYTRVIYRPQQSSRNCRKYRNFTSSVGRCRITTVVTNKQIDALFMQEATDKDSVVVEIIRT